MARKYYANHTSLAGVNYRVEIWDDPSGSTSGGTELKLSGEGYQLQYQGDGDKLYENPIRPSSVTAFFAINSQTDLDFFEAIATNQESKFAMVIYKNSALHWIGRILPDQIRWERKSFKNVIIFQVKSVDALNLMKNFQIQYSWFSSAGRLNMLDLIIKSLQFAKLDLYWNHLSASANYICDGSPLWDYNTTDERLKKREINVISCLLDYDVFTAQNGMPEDWQNLKNCFDVIDDILISCESRLFHSGGRYWILGPVDYAVNTTSIGYNIYSTSGVKTNSSPVNFAHKLTISDNINRPNFNAFPMLSHQPALRYFKSIYQRVGAERAIRTFANQSSSTLGFSGLQIPNPALTFNLRATLNFAAMYWGPSTVPPASQVYIRYKIYELVGSNIYKYNYTNSQWELTSTIPDWQVEAVAVSKYEWAGSNIIYTVDFLKRFNVGAGNLYDLHVYFEVVGVNNTPIAPGSSSGINFWGDIAAFYKDENKFSYGASNTLNPDASEKFEREINYYPSSSLFQNGMIYNLLHGDLVTSTTIDGGSTAYPFPECIAVDFLSIYSRAARVIDAVVNDAGNYSAIKTLYFDNSIWVFNAGTFNANTETWDGQWIRVVYNLGDITPNGEGEVISGGTNSDQVSMRIFGQLDMIRNSINNYTDALPYQMIRIADNAPVSEPPIQNDYTVMLRFDPVRNAVVYNLEERGKQITYNDGTHYLPVDVQTILCNCAPGDVLVYLPAPNTNKGYQYTFKKITSTGQAKIDGNGVNIDGGTHYDMTGNWEFVTVESDGSQYYVISKG